MPLVLSTEERLSFEGSCRIVTVRGPLTLFRLVGRTATGQANYKYGRFWFHDRLFWRVLDEISQQQSDEAMMNFLVRRLLREFTAICYDWNSFAAVYTLELPAAHSLEAAVGRIKSQPYFSANDPHKRTDPLAGELLGGEFQYVIDIAPSLQKFVKGPIPANFRIGHA